MANLHRAAWVVALALGAVTVVGGAAQAASPAGSRAAAGAERAADVSRSVAATVLPPAPASTATPIRADAPASLAQAPCTYKAHHTPKRAPQPHRTRHTSSAGTVSLLVTGVLSAEGWVPPPGETCPPTP